jgi:hypothetical protein
MDPKGGAEMLNGEMGKYRSQDLVRSAERDRAARMATRGRDERLARSRKAAAWLVAVATWPAAAPAPPPTAPHC